MEYLPTSLLDYLNSTSLKPIKSHQSNFKQMSTQIHISSNESRLDLVFQEIVHSATLWRIWARLGIQDIRLRFRRSALGIGWIFLNLAIMILAVGFIYSNLFGQDLSTFIPQLTIGLIIWGYLTNSIVEGGGAFINSEGYIKQISLPLYIYVFRSFTSIGLYSLISLMAYLVVALIYRVPTNLGTLWTLPGLALLTTVSFGLIFVFAHLTARFRDAAHLATALMQVLFYVTPVIYPVELIRVRELGWVVDFNPFYHLLQVVRHPLLTGTPAGLESYLVVLAVIALLIGAMLLIGRLYRRSIVFLL